MANPVIVPCPAGDWTKVATNVTTGQIKKLKTDPNKYLETYRTSGDPVPTEATEGVPIFIESYSETISASAGIDVYIMAVGANGSVRADLP
jgi:hypothetical protein